MRTLNNSGKINLFILALIVIVILAITFSWAVAVYQKVSGNNITGKIFYVLDKGKQHAEHYYRKMFSYIPGRASEKVGQQGDEVLYFSVKADEPVRSISPLIYGSNLTSKTEFEMDVAKFGKDLGITNFRFPGGNSFGYRWKLGEYDFEDRFDNAPLSKIDSVIKFCGIVGVKLIVQVNVESGTAKEAADWVRFMNKGLGMRVDYWEIGNEVYGDWDKGYMSGEEYVKVVKKYSRLMKKVDPTIKIGADWGGPKYQEFDRAVIEKAADYIDFVSYHWYPNHINNSHRYENRNHPFPQEIMANYLAVEGIVKRFEGMVKEYAPHRDEEIEFTVMEWDGSWDGVSSDLAFEHKGVLWSLANAIFHADALGEFAKYGITVANQYAFQEVMFGFIRGWDVQAGWGGSPWDGESIRPKALAFKLLARYFGDVLIESTLTGSPSYYKKADWWADSFTGEVPYVSGYASKSSSEDMISIVLTNKHAEKDFPMNISIDGAVLREQGEVWILSGPDLNAQNDGDPGSVAVKKYDLSDVGNKFNYLVPRHSVNLLRIPYSVLKDSLN